MSQQEKAEEAIKIATAFRQWLSAELSLHAAHESTPAFYSLCDAFAYLDNLLDVLTKEED